VAAADPARRVTATALWTAYCRAEESGREDALVVDPFAARLCGDDGLSIGRAFEAKGGAHDAIVVRTRIIDDLLLAALARGERNVLSLGAGLCARTHRLTLPLGTRFVEVDLPANVAWKERHLAGTPTPAGASVARFGADLQDPAQLEAPLRSLDGSSLFVILEGVIQYLPARDVRTLFSRLAARPLHTTVVCDVGGGAWSRFFARRVPDTTGRAGAPYLTRIDDPRAFFEPLGFQVTADVSLVEWDARRPVPRFRAPWTARLVPGFRNAARVIELVARP
jgi:methyltransferase (TIGR00027 family)